MAQQGRNIEALLQMAKDPSARNALAKSVVDLCLADGSTLSAREVALTFEILHALLRSVEMGVRRDLAQRLAYRPDVPHGLIVTLANDQINVAYPVLVESVVLEDFDLIAIAQGQPASHQIAITLREQVSSDVSDALIDTDNIDVIDSLMRNPTAEIAPVAMERLVEMSREAMPLRRPLLQRQDLEPELAHKMSAWVGDALKEYITTNYPEASESVEFDIDAAVRRVSAAPDAQATRDLNDRVTEIEGEDGITAATLIEALSLEDVELFEALFARRTGIETAAMPVLIYDPGGEPFAVACKACGFQLEEFKSLYLLLTKNLAGEQDTDSEEFKRISAYYAKLDDGAARGLIDEWTKAPATAWDTS
jgi:uncharacterized protein (DUF2336 family)